MYHNFSKPSTFTVRKRTAAGNGDLPMQTPRWETGAGACRGICPRLQPAQNECVQQHGTFTVRCRGTLSESGGSSFGSAVSTCRRSRTRKENSTARTSAVTRIRCGILLRIWIARTSEMDRRWIESRSERAESGSEENQMWIRTGRRQIKWGSAVRFGSDVDRACVESGSDVVQMWIERVSKADRACVKSGPSLCQMWIDRGSGMDRAHEGDGWKNRPPKFCA